MPVPVHDILAWMESSGLGTTVRNSDWIFPMLETLHFMGLCTLFGAIMVVDLRLLGVARFIPMRPALSFVPIAIGGFCVNLVSGVSFFFSDPFRYYPNVAFRLKMLLILIAGLNALWFQFVELPKVRDLQPGDKTSLSVRFIAALSLLLWIGVIIAGRFMPYVEP